MAERSGTLDRIKWIVGGLVLAMLGMYIGLHVADVDATAWGATIDDKTVWGESFVEGKQGDG